MGRNKAAKAIVMTAAWRKEMLKATSSKSVWRELEVSGPKERKCSRSSPWPSGWWSTRPDLPTFASRRPWPWGCPPGAPPPKPWSLEEIWHTTTCFTCWRALLVMFTSLELILLTCWSPTQLLTITLLMGESNFNIVESLPWHLGRRAQPHLAHDDWSRRWPSLILQSLCAQSKTSRQENCCFTSVGFVITLSTTVFLYHAKGFVASEIYILWV